MHVPVPAALVAPLSLAACTLLASLAVAAAPRPAAAGPVNPDISVIGDVRATWTDADPAADELDLALRETELAWVGPVNPYASAEVYLGIHGTEGIEVEEAKLLLDRYLPARLGLVVGRQLLDFGQLNTVHSHAYPFLDRPRMHEEFFGADGILDTAVRLDWIAPLDGPTIRATVGAIRGDILVGGHVHAHDAADAGADPAADTAEADPEIGVSGRLELFAEPSDAVSFLVGGSVLHGEHDPHAGAKATWLDVDAKLRLDLGPYRTLVVSAEGVLGSLDAVAGEQAAVDPNGWFASADLRLDKRWNLGGFAESTTERLDDDVRTNRFGGFVGLALMEETTLFRLVGRVTDPDAGDSSTEVIAQTLFALGPHRPHRY